MNYFELGWMVVCFIAGACILVGCVLFALEKISHLYTMTLFGAKEAAVREYAISLRKQSYWFNGRDKAIVEAVAMDMEQGRSYACADTIRDRHLPDTLAQNS